MQRKVAKICTQPRWSQTVEVLPTYPFLTGQQPQLAGRFFLMINLAEVVSGSMIGFGPLAPVETVGRAVSHTGGI